MAGEVERLIVGGFASAHRTHAPGLSADENQRLYGICNNPGGHGHNYRAEVRVAPASAGVNGLWARYDHRNLSLDVPEFSGRNVVTELIAADVAAHARARSARVWETPEFFADYLTASGRYRLGRRYHFNAAHRLHSLSLSAAENEATYGKCNRVDPHGHTYRVEVTVAAAGLDARTGTAYDLGQLDAAAQRVLAPLDFASLDTDVAFFQAHPSTGENIALYLWGEFERVLGPALDEINVWETPNNRFTVRR
jgi:6-pyruvoyltetrahydropterin/6-carboxytetrahydropterin synthase